jgi:phosphoglycerate dehydrogenase-like enzyme
MMRIALLGNTTAQAERLSRQLPFDHEIFGIDNLPEERIDVAVGLRFGEAEAKRLQPRLLHLPGAGADAIDLEWLPRDCTLCNVFEHEGPIAEYVFLAMLDWEIGYSAMTRSFSASTWSHDYRTRKPHGEIAGKTIGLVGVGHIGSAIAARASAFGMKVIAIASKTRPAAQGMDWIGDKSRLDELMGLADYVVVACPLSDTTRGLIGKAQIAAMKPTGVLINIARGEIVDEQGLFEALSDNRIGGAVLDAWFRYPTGAADVVEPSQFGFDQLPNVRCTPHASAWTSALFERRYQLIAENIRRFAAGEALSNVLRSPGKEAACLS